LLPTNFISDLERAIDARSNKTGSMLHQITDLFLVNAGHYSTDQVHVYDEILKLLITKVDTAARATLARRIAAAEQAPADAVRSLALDDSIEVAEPILSQSKVLDDDVLVDCIANRGQEHLLAIATRSSLSETVCDHLISKGDRNVLGAVVNNPDAKISEPGFGLLVNKSVGDDWLSECIGRRSDIPDHHFRQLVVKVSETVRSRLIGNDPHQRQLIDAILPPAERTLAASIEAKDYRTAELIVKSQPLTEVVVNEFATTKKLEELVVAVAQLSGLSTSEIERLLMGTWSSPVAVIFKAIGFHLATMHAIYCARAPANAPTQLDLVRTKAEFIALRRLTAERILRFYQIRKSTAVSEPSI
jgi:uncharacterized protein (DUF2336 family)